MSTYVGIDPGVHACGIACVRDGKVIAAGYIKESAHRGGDIARAMSSAVQGVAGRSWPIVGIEFPRTYAGRAKGKADANDLIELGYTVGRIEMAINEAHVVRVTVQSWKANITTDALEARLKMPAPLGLTPAEWAAVKLPAPSYRHNVFDAIALARWLSGWSARNPSKKLKEIKWL